MTEQLTQTDILIGDSSIFLLFFPANSSFYCQAEEFEPVIHPLWSLLYKQQFLKSHSYALQSDEQSKASL